MPFLRDFVPRLTRKKWTFLLLALGVSGLVRADEFQAMSDNFGTTLTLAGVHNSNTSNPDGSSINFWTPDSEGALASTTSLSNPHMAAADAYGNIYIADKASHSILKISTDGLIHTFAGTHEAGFNGDGPAPATSLQVDAPNGLFVRPNGVVYLLDPGNHRIRRVNTDGIMTTVVNDPEPRWASSGRALWVSQDEQLIYYTHEFRPVPPSTINDGAVVKKWTSARGIEIVCAKQVGFLNPANVDVNPFDGKLYVTDRGEEDTSGTVMGLFRIDAINQRTRMTGNATQPAAQDGRLALNSNIVEPRGIAFRPDGSYFICGHKDGNVWFVDKLGVLHLYLRGLGRKDGYTIPDEVHPPLTDREYFAQPRSVTLAPNGNLIVVCNDSGYVFRVNDVAPPVMPNDFALSFQSLNDVKLSWTGIYGRGYRIEEADDLAPPSWTPAGAVRGQATGKSAFTEQVPGMRPQRYYRLLPAL